MSSGKKLARLNLGILRFSVHTQVLSVLSLYPFLLLPQAEHISFASMSITAFTTISASWQKSSWRLIDPSANFGISAAAAAHTACFAMLSFGLRPFHKPVMLRFQILGRRPPSFLREALQAVRRLHQH